MASGLHQAWAEVGSAHLVPGQRGKATSQARQGTVSSPNARSPCEKIDISPYLEVVSFSLPSGEVYMDFTISRECSLYIVAGVVSMTSLLYSNEKD